MESLSFEGITNKILDGLRSNYNFPMVKDILLSTEDLSDISMCYVKMVLKDSFEFAFDNGNISNTVNLTALI